MGRTRRLSPDRYLLVRNTTTTQDSRPCPRPSRPGEAMPTAPTILPTQITQGAAPGLNYRLEGELVPVLHMALDGQVPIYFEHHVLLWKYPEMQIGLHPLKGSLKRRAFCGMPLLLLEAQSPGEIAFSRDAPGHIAALHIPPGDGIIVREHQFLAATGGVQYDY